VYYRVQVGASLGACPGVYLRTNSEVYLGAYSLCTWECLESLGGRVSQVGWECTIETVQSGVYFRVYLRACNEVQLAVLLNAA
jgi:hypothetical protein